MSTVIDTPIANQRPATHGQAQIQRKSSDFGSIPGDWQVRSLGELEPFITSGSRGWAQFYSEAGNPFVRITNLSRDSIYLDFSSLKFVRLPDGLAEADRTALRDGDILISITADIGIVGYVDAKLEKPAYINQHIALVRMNPQMADSRFLSYFLASERSQRVFRGLTDQGAKAGMGLEKLLRLRVAAPEPAEQRAIAAALSDVDALINELDRLIAKKRAIRFTSLKGLLGGRIRLPGFSGKWVSVQLNEVAEANWGNTSVTKASYQTEGYRAFSASGSDGFLKWYEQEGPAVVLSAIGAQCGKTWLTSGKWTAIKNTIWFRANEDCADTGFLYYLTAEPSFWPNRGQAQPFIALGDVRRATLRMPASLDEQRAISKILSDMDSEIAALQHKWGKNRAIKQGMMQQLLTGRIRLLQPEEVA